MARQKQEKEGGEAPEFFLLRYAKRGDMVLPARPAAALKPYVCWHTYSS